MGAFEPPPHVEPYEPPPHVEPYRAPPFHLFVWQNFRAVLLHPKAFWAQEPLEAPWLPAAAYAWVVSNLGRLIGHTTIQVSQFEANWLVGGLAPQFHARHAAFFHWLESASHGTLRLPLEIGVLSWPLRFFAAAALVEVSLLLAKRAGSGFGATLRICAYASTPMFFSHLPVLWVPALAYAAVQLGLGLKQLARPTAAVPARPLSPGVRKAGKVVAVAAVSGAGILGVVVIVVLVAAVALGALAMLVLGRC